MTAWPYWPLPPVWRTKRPLPSRRAPDGLAIGDLRLADVGGDLELADHPVDEHVEVQLAHAGDEGLGRLRVGVDAEGRILLGRRWRASASLSWSAFVFGSILTSMTGSGKVIDSRITGWLRIGQGVTGEGVLEPDGRGDVAGVDGVDLFAVVGVHLEDAADPLLLALGRVEDVRAGLERARVDPEEGELADERVGGDLEREGAERLAVVRRAQDLGAGLRVEADHRRHVERRRQVVDDRVEHLLDALVA